jgi:putative hydrolase of HD superfamily
MTMEEIVRLLFEAGMLKLVPRSGWLKIGIKNPESVAEHSFRTALIAFIITYLETLDSSKASKAALLGLIHDLHESRTLDLHELSRRYISIKSEALKDQLSLLGDLRKEIEVLRKELGEFVEDADKLELLVQAKEYSESHPSAMVYAEGINFKTKSAKKLAEAIRKTDHRWWLRFEEG